MSARSKARKRALDVLFEAELRGLPVLELLVFIEVGQAIGWLLAVVLLIGASLLGVQLLRIQGRSAIDRVSLVKHFFDPTVGDLLRHVSSLRSRWRAACSSAPFSRS